MHISKSNTIFLKAFNIDISVEQCTAELTQFQSQLWPNCDLQPGVEVRVY